jgi:hypothetical protein
MKSLGAATLLACGTLLLACCKLPEPSGPDPVPDRDPVVATPAPGGPTPSMPALGAPAPSPSPDPVEPPEEPSDEPTPEPSPTANGCGSPTPPPISRFNVKVHLRGASFWTLDATPLVGPDAAYCASIGFTDGREYCPVRPEGHPEREACEAAMVGKALDTGRPGPTWRLDGSFCSGADDCENHPENQYFVKAYASGSYQACARNGACGVLDVSR